jgi:antitoxin component of MazEF toxin-antitoxin module
MTVKLQKIGNSHMLTIPVQFLKQLGWRLGDELSFKTVNSSLEITLAPKKKYKSFADIPVGTIHVKPVDFETELQWYKEGPYERVDAWIEETMKPKKKKKNG